MQRRQQIPREYRSHPNFSEVWQVGGDACTAIAVAKKTGTGSWVVYNIFRDHLGTITHLKNGSTIDEYSYDSWGRRRDKDNWSYTLSGEPALFADRGFTSHEFLSDFNLYNMNGRLYDPVLGRFLSPDPYIADPSFTQSYNRYSYVLNNPLKYNDPTGELPAWALWGIASAGNWLFGGMDNWINKGMSFKQSFSTANNPVTFSGNYHPGSNSLSNSQVNAHRLVGSMANAERGVHSYVAGFSGMGRNFNSWLSDHFIFESEFRIDYGLQARIEAKVFGVEVGGGIEDNTKPLAQLNIGFNNELYGKIYSLDNPMYGYGNINDPIRKNWSAALGGGIERSYAPTYGFLNYEYLISETINKGAYSISTFYNINGNLIESRYYWSYGFDLAAILGLFCRRSDLLPC